LLIFLNESTIKQHPVLKAKWMLQGSKEYVKTLGNHAKTNIFGAITALGSVFHMKSAKQNSGVFIKFLEHLMALNPKKRLVLVIDNTPWHKSKKVQTFLDKVQDKIQVLLLPAYSPDMNPIDHLWRFMKSVVANVFFLKMKDLNNALTDFFKSLYSSTKKILSLCSPDYLLG
jgi:transposase